MWNDETNYHCWSNPVNLMVILLLAGDIVFNCGPTCNLDLTNIRYIRQKHAVVSEMIRTEEYDLMTLHLLWQILHPLVGYTFHSLSQPFGSEDASRRIEIIS